MNNKERYVVCAVIAVLIAFLLGVNFGQKNQSEKYLKEKEEDVEIKRSAFETIGDIKGTIYVTGHKNPDTDSVCCAMAYAKLLKELGYDVKAVILGDINKETSYILKQLDMETPEIIYDVSGENVVLVDHSEYAQSAEGLQDANVICVIDHHGAGGFSKTGALIFDSRPYGALATIIYQLYRDYGVDIDEKTAFLLAAAIMSDTINLRSEVTTQGDRIALRRLLELSGINNSEEFYKAMTLAKYDYSDMSDEEIFTNDYKDYEFANFKYGIPVAMAYDEDQARELSVRMKKVLPEMVKRNGDDFIVIMVGIFHDDLDIAYLTPSDEFAAAIIKDAYPGSTFDGTSYIIIPGMSRKQGLVPKINEILANHPHE